MIYFLRYKLVYLIISLIFLGVGGYSVVMYGLNYSIDFTGGSVLEYRFEKQISRNELTSILDENKIELVSFEQKKNTIIFRTSPIDEKQEVAIRKSLQDLSKDENLTVVRFETVGPTLGKETIKKTIVASIVAIIGILIYISFTFKKLSYGLAAVGAMLHDFFILIGMYSLLSHFYLAEVDALFITAVLTTMSFSVHDTIVVFDKIREYQKTSALSIDILANKALTETMIRSVNNSLTIILMLVPLVFMGGETIRFFAAALLIGTITGTYSSPFVATPLLVLLEKK